MTVGTRRHLRVPAQLDRLSEIRALVRGVADAADATVSCMDDLIQAVDEAATNVIVHGYAGAAGVLEVEAEVVGDRIVITLTDGAPTFDPTTLSSPDLTIPPELRRPGGMGVHLMRLATDELRHAARPGGGNVLTLARRLDLRPKEVDR